jgi:predicted transcriptional regulator
LTRNLENRIDINNNSNSRLTILSVINQLPGVRYNDLARITKRNNGVISHSLCILEKNYCIKVVRYSNGKITRYFSISIPDEYHSVIGYLKNETTRKIILFLHYNGKSNFKKIRFHINKASSTTSWNLKRLADDDIIVRLKAKNNYYIIKNPILVAKILQSSINLLLDRDTDVTKLSITA